MRLRIGWLFVAFQLSSLSPLPILGQDLGYVLAARGPVSNRPVRVLVVAPDSSWFVAGGEDLAQIFDLGERAELGSRRALPRPPSGALGAAISADGATLAVVDEEGAVHVIEVASLIRTSTIPATRATQAVAVTFSADGSYLLTGGKKGELNAWTLDGALFARLDEGRAHDREELVLVAGVPPGRRLLSIGQDRQMILWDTDVQRALRSSLLDLDVLSAAVGGDGKILVLGLQRLTGNRFRSADRQPLRTRAYDVIRLIDTETGAQLRDLEGEEQDIKAVAVTPDGRFVTAGGSASHASIWRADSGSRITRIPFSAPVTALEFSPDGKWMLAGTRDGQLSLFTLTGVGPVPRPEPPAAQIIIVIIEPETLSIERGAPGEMTRVATSSLRVRGRVKTAAPLKSLQVDGREITSISSDEPGDYTFTAYVPLLVAGRHEIEILAENQAGEVTLTSFAVERAASLPPPDPTRGRRIAFIVGISHYAHPSVRLEFAEDDARALYDLLTDPALGPAAFREQDMRLLLDEEATAAAINTGLRDFLQRARADDVVLFFFAGHGVPDPNRLQDLYLMAHDTDPENIAGTGILMRHVREAIAEIPAHNVVILTDACHSAGIAAPKGIRNLTVNPIHEVFLEKMRHSSGGLAILTASEAAQVSLESSRWEEHGVFTYFLLQGLRGAADENADGIVTLGELMEYVRERVKLETGARQIPTIGPTSFDRQLPLVLIPDH